MIGVLQPLEGVPQYTVIQKNKRKTAAPTIFFKSPFSQPSDLIKKFFGNPYEYSQSALNHNW